MRDPMYVRYDRSYGKKKRKKNSSGLPVLVAVTAVLVVTVFVVFLISLLQEKPKVPIDPTATSSSLTTADGSVVTIPIVTATPVPVVTIAPFQNPVIYPASAQMNVPMGTPGDSLSVAERGVSENVFVGPDTVSPYNRETPVVFGDPSEFQDVPGILTFRGNNFRNCAAWGVAPTGATTLEQVWEYNRIGSMKSSSWSFYWSGTGWTGQPLVITWSDEVRQVMNIYPEKKAKAGLTEVIQVAMDGKIYFFDMDDGTQTRDPMTVGFTIKGTPCVDPRGYPILYVGQGDNNSAEKQVGFRIISLIDYSVLYYQNGMDDRAHRTTWGACDSSPIVNKDTDTLIYPNENGMIYTIKLNTSFDPATGSLSIDPDSVVYRYLIDGVRGNDLGIESSVAVYDHFAYCSDNTGNLICVDLNTLKMVWVRQLDDDSDVTPVIEEENGRVYLYTGTEVDWQRTDVLNYLGDSFTYKIDAMTGELIWQASAECYTKNGEDKGDDVNGGMLGTPIIGKKSISNLVIFSYCMTNGTYSGNRMVAYSKDTGEKVWTYEMNQYSWSSPVDCYDADGNAYIVICDSVGQIHLVNGQTGVRITYLQTIRNIGTADESKEGLNMESSPIIFNDMIIIGSRAGSVFGVRIR